MQKKSRIQETLNLSTCLNKKNNTKNKIKILKKSGGRRPLSCVKRQVSDVTFRVSPVTYRISLKPTATATDPPLPLQVRNDGIFVYLIFLTLNPCKWE